MKKINWSELIFDLTEALIMNQTDLAKAIGTTQQSISNWLNGRRGPSDFKAKIILELAEQAGIDWDLEKYDISHKDKQKYLKKKEFKELPLNIRRLMLRISQLSTRKQNSVVRYLEDMMDR